MMHFSAMNSPSTKTYGLFVDDKPEYAIFFYTALTQFPSLIPKSCVFFPVLYRYNCVNNISSLPTLMGEYCITGTGVLYPEILTLCRDWLVTLKQYNLVSTQDAFTNNLELFKQHFSALIPTKISTPSTLSSLPQRLFNDRQSMASQSLAADDSHLPSIHSTSNSPRVTQRKRLLSLPAI